MTRRDVDDAIAALARRQHGVFAVRQATAVGATASLIRRRVEAGVWVRLDRGVLGLVSAPGTWHRQLKVVELGHPDGVISGRPAAALRQLGGLRRGRPELTVPGSSHHRTSLGSVRYRDGITTTICHGIRVTDLPQTLVDIAGMIDRTQLVRAVEDALLDHRLEPATLQARAALAGERRLAGAGTLRDVVDELIMAGAPSMSALERRLRAALDRAGLHHARFEAAPPWWPDGPERVDALLMPERTIVEGDGRAWHRRLADFENDRRRDNLAALHHHRVVRLTWRMLTVEVDETDRLLRGLAS